MNYNIISNWQLKNTTLREKNSFLINNRWKIIQFTIIIKNNKKTMGKRIIVINICKKTKINNYNYNKMFVLKKKI